MGLLAATGFGALVPILIALACPLVMILMMRGGKHGHHHSDVPRGEMTLEELKRERDRLNEEIGQRAEQRRPRSHRRTENA